MIIIIINFVTDAMDQSRDLGVFVANQLNSIDWKKSNSPSFRPYCAIPKSLRPTLQTYLPTWVHETLEDLWNLVSILFHHTPL
jgi:hypothetical protein